MSKAISSQPSNTARYRLATWLVAACIVLGPGTARAEPDSEPSSESGEYSPYEQAAIENAARSLGSPIDENPEGKVIERIEVVTLEPVEPRDPPPLWLNDAHTTTRPYVVRRDLLVQVGDTYRKVLVDESARILRLHPQLSVVLCVALRGTARDRVWLVVITKDVWSLLLDFDLQIENGGYNYILLEPKETNLLGTHETILGRLDLQPKAFSLGGAYEEPRLGGSWISVLADANVILEKAGGAPEGSYGTLEVIRPLASTFDHWSWFTDVAWRSEITRRYSSGRVYSVDLGPNQVNDEHHTRRSLLEGALTRSFGWKQKSDVTLSFSMSRDEYWVDPDVRAAIDAGLLPRAPTSDRRVGPALEVHFYTSDFLRTLDYDTLGLQEDYRLGYDLVIQGYPVLAAFGSTRSVMGVYAAAQYTLPLGTGLIRGACESRTEWSLAADAASCGASCGLADASLGGDLTVVSPLTPAGRLLFGAHVLNRYQNYLNAISYLGNESTLRGYPAAAFAGDDYAVANVEWRTRPLEALSMQWALGAFYDVGNAFDRFDHIGLGGGLRSDVGAGVRMVWPEIERSVFRLDFGFPLNRAPPPGKMQDVDPWTFSFSFGQAFGTETISGMTSPKGNAALE